MSVQKHEVREHMAVIGSDGGHVGTVDRVEGDRIKLTKQDDPDGSGQHHHYIPLAEVRAVEGGQVRLTATASAARSAAASRGDQGQGAGMSGLAEAAGQAFDTARARVEQTARQAGNWAEEAYNDAGAKARDATSSMSRTVEEQPMVAAVVAGALGFALGALAMSYWQRQQPEARRGSWNRHGRERRNPDGGRVGSSATAEGSAAYSSIPTN